MFFSPQLFLVFWVHILRAFAVSIRLFFPHNGIQTKSYAPHKNAALSTSLILWRQFKFCHQTSIQQLEAT